MYLREGGWEYGDGNKFSVTVCQKMSGISSALGSHHCQRQLKDVSLHQMNPQTTEQCHSQHVTHMLQVGQAWGKTDIKWLPYCLTCYGRRESTNFNHTIHLESILWQNRNLKFSEQQKHRFSIWMSPTVQHCAVWHKCTNILGKPWFLALSILYCPEDSGCRLPQHVDTYPPDSKACHLLTKKNHQTLH